MEISQLSLEEYRRECAGQPYRALVEFHVVRHAPDELVPEIRGTLARLSDLPRDVAAGYFNKWNVKGQHREVRELDCAEALDLMVRDARRLLRERGLGDGEDRLLLLFRLATLGVAFTAARHGDVRRRMGIRNAPELTSP